jgi:hypothetical protein
MSRRNEKLEEDSDASDMSESTSEQESHNKEDDDDEQDDDDDDDETDDSERSQEESEEGTNGDPRLVDHLSEESESGYSSKSSYDGTNSNQSESDSSSEQIIQVVNIQMSPGKVILAPLPRSPSESSDQDLNKSGIDSLLSTEDDDEENEIVFGKESPPGDDEALFGMQAWQEPSEHLELELMEACRKLQDFDDAESKDPTPEHELQDKNASAIPTIQTSKTPRNISPINSSAAKSKALESPTTSEGSRQLNSNNMSQESSITTEGSVTGVVEKSQTAIKTSKSKGIWNSIWNKKTQMKQDDNGLSTNNTPVADEDNGKDLVTEKDSGNPGRLIKEVPMHVNSTDEGDGVGANSVKEKETLFSRHGTMQDEHQCGTDQSTGGRPLAHFDACTSRRDEPKATDYSIVENQTKIVRAKGLISGSFGRPSEQENSGGLRCGEINEEIGDVQPKETMQVEDVGKKNQKSFFSPYGTNEKGRTASGLITALRWKPRAKSVNDSSRESDTPGRFNEYTALSQNETPPSRGFNSDDDNDTRHLNQSSPDDDYKLWTNVGRTVSSDEESQERPPVGSRNDPHESRNRWFVPRKMNLVLNERLSTGVPLERSEQRSQKSSSEEIQPNMMTIQHLCMMMWLFLILVIASSVGTSYVGTKLALRGQTFSSTNDNPLSTASSPSPQSIKTAPTYTDIPEMPTLSPVGMGSSTPIPTGMPTPAAKSFHPSNPVITSVPAVRTSPPVPSPIQCSAGDSLLQFEIVFDSEPSDVGILLRDSGTLGAGIWVLESSSFRSFTQFQRKNFFSICLSNSNSYVFEVTDTTGDGLVSVVGGASNVYGYWKLSFGSKVVAEYNGSCNASTSMALIVECGKYCLCSFTVSATSSTGGCDTQCSSTR